MCDINPGYKKNIWFKDGRKMLYLHILKAIYGMVEYDLLWYDIYMSVIKDMRFHINTYVMCVTNK